MARQLPARPVPPRSGPTRTPSSCAQGHQRLDPPPELDDPRGRCRSGSITRHAILNPMPLPLASAGLTGGPGHPQVPGNLG
jgi:hypothetical protein